MSLAACSVTRLDAGSTGKPDGPSDAGAEAGDQGELLDVTPSNDTGVDCKYPASDFSAGVWKGRFDSYLPITGSSIEIDVKGTYDKVHACGKVIFGSGPPVPLPTDPTVAPPSAPPEGSLDIQPVGGFPYSMSEYLTNGSDPDAGPSHRLHLAVNFLEVYNAWCNMQRSYLEFAGLDPSKSPGDQTQQIISGSRAAGQYGCIPPHSISSAPGGEPCDNELSGLNVHGISCEQAKFCVIGICSCRGSSTGLAGEHISGGCAAGSMPGKFDLTIDADGKTMTGSYLVNDTQTTVETLTLTRQ